MCKHVRVLKFCTRSRLLTHTLGVIDSFQHTLGYMYCIWQRALRYLHCHYRFNLLDLLEKSDSFVQLCIRGSVRVCSLWFDEWINSPLQFSSFPSLLVLWSCSVTWRELECPQIQPLWDASPRRRPCWWWSISPPPSSSTTGCSTCSLLSNSKRNSSPPR